MAEIQNEQEVREGRFFAAISYISFLCIVSLVLKKDNKFCLYHAKQGLVLFAFEVAAFILSIIPILGWLIGVFGYALFLIASIWGVIQVTLGVYCRIPVISKIALQVIL